MADDYLHHVERMKRIFELVAYGSLGIDMAITIVTLISVNAPNHELASLQLLLNYALSAVFIVSVVLLLSIVVMEHYEKIIDKFADAGFRRTKKRHGQMKLAHHAGKRR